MPSRSCHIWRKDLGGSDGRSRSLVQWEKGGMGMLRNRPLREKGTWPRRPSRFKCASSKGLPMSQE